MHRSPLANRQQSEGVGSDNSSLTWQHLPIPSSWAFVECEPCQNTLSGNEVCSNETKYPEFNFTTQMFPPSVLAAAEPSATWSPAEGQTSMNEPPSVEQAVQDVQPTAPVIENIPPELSFMETYPLSNAALSFGNDEAVNTIRHINLDIIEKRCPLLATAFEESRAGPRLYLETLTSATAAPFLRFLYTGTYTTGGTDGALCEDAPTSLLLHCRMYWLGEYYHLPELKGQGYLQILRQCEFGCSLPDPPIDLHAAIRYMYKHLRGHENVVDTLVNYCVSCCLRHRLTEDAEFRKLLYDIRPFHQALCKNSMERDCADEAAAAFIRLPSKPHNVDTYISCEDPGTQRFRGAIKNFHAATEASQTDDANGKKRKQRPEWPDRRKLAIRPRKAFQAAERDGSVSADEDFVYISSNKCRSFSSQRQMAPHATPAIDSDYEIVANPTEECWVLDDDFNVSTPAEVSHDDAPASKDAHACNGAPEEPAGPPPSPSPSPSSSLSSSSADEDKIHINSEGKWVELKSLL